MSHFTFELARMGDEADLRRVLAAVPQEGTIEISSRREPSFFGGGVVEGRERQVIIARETKSGRAIGLGSRSILPRYVNGAAAPIGYLSSLRLMPDYRNSALTARGYALFKVLHADARTHLYLSTFADQDELARELLAGGRQGLPAFHQVGRFVSVAIPLMDGHSGGGSGASVRTATADDLPQVIEFLQEVGPRRQFFPCYQAHDFFTSEGLFRDLAPEDLFLAFRGERLVGTLGGWDQRGFRQQVVYGYRAPLRWLRPAINLWARARGRPALPAPGQSLSLLRGALPVVADDNPSVFAYLLESLIARKMGGPWSHLLVGLHEADPLAVVLKRYRARSFVRRLCLVCWPDGERLRQALDGRPPYLELGSL